VQTKWQNYAMMCVRAVDPCPGRSATGAPAPAPAPALALALALGVRSSPLQLDGCTALTLSAGIASTSQRPSDAGDDAADDMPEPSSRKALQHRGWAALIP